MGGEEAAINALISLRRPVDTPAAAHKAARRLLSAVAVLFLLGAVALVDVGRAPLFDEAIYLSEVQRGAEGISFAPHRARGITWLIAPVAALGGPIWGVRLLLAVTSALALFPA